MAARTPGIVSLLVLLIALMPFAYASPPDQTWLAGLYDNADHDDAIMLLTSAVGVPDATPAPDLGRLISVILTHRPSKPALPDPSFRSPYHFRAPPLV